MTRARDTLHDWSNCDHVDDCRDVKRLLDQVEDDRAHADAERIRAEAKEEQGVADSGAELYERAAWSACAMLFVADMIDPYEMRDGQLVRKADGKPVNL